MDTPPNPPPWHASPRPDAAPYSDRQTGEVRVPTSLYAVDERLRDIELVMTRAEGEAHLQQVRAALAAATETAVHGRPREVA
ncbi:hypothetical protein ABZ733_23565 [Streptomyces longwoodensis]|uniref:hypothetical protein n=1 Tax=Streptomyces longwoodensis TaxID=68231 RepID=UPI0033F1C32E